MADKHQWILFIVLLCTSAAISEETKDLDEAEANGKLEIIKQIKKINEDGSYTIGYEADDGSFKIESRDVLGNIKGTYGYIDEHGEIKRVSYSSTNTTSVTQEPPTEPPVTSSVVQRIPKILKSNTTTKKPIVIYPAVAIGGSNTGTNAIQSIPRRRLGSTSTSTSTSTTTQANTEKPSLEELLDNSRVQPTKSNTVYSTVAPARILVQSRPLLRSTAEAQKPEVPQIVRPEVSTTRSEPLYRRFNLKNTLLDSESSSTKPVTEEPEVRSNLLRRELNPDKVPFDPRQHALNLQQAVGRDSVDVYSASVTTGTPRPLFTTTSRPRILSTTTGPPIRPTGSRFQAYQRPPIREQRILVQPQVQQESTTDASVEVPRYTTPSPVPVVQIPANRQEQDQEQFVAVRHPFHRGTILVPVNQFQQREVPIQQEPREFQPAQYLVTKEQYLRDMQPTIAPLQEEPRQAPIFLRRMPQVPHRLRAMQVHVDENGYIREIPPQVYQPAQFAPPTHVPMVVPVMQPSPRFDEQELQSDIDRIKPPVSTRDFQKLLGQLILRQSRLEQISMIARQPDVYRPRDRPVYQQVPQPFVLRRPDVQAQANGPIQFVHTQQSLPSRDQQYIAVNQNNQPILYRQHPTQNPNAYLPEPQYQHNQDAYNAAPEPYTPSRRVARLLNPKLQQDESTNEEFLPPDVREMLLLRMLQLAINPALPLDESEMEMIAKTPSIPMKKDAVRNVEILGEEDDPKKNNRVKRFKNYEDFYGY